MTTMTAEVATEVYYQEEKYANERPHFWGCEQNNASAISTHESILNLTTDDEDGTSPDVSRHLDESFLSIDTQEEPVYCNTAPLNQCVPSEKLIVTTTVPTDVPPCSEAATPCDQHSTNENSTAPLGKQSPTFTEWTSKFLDTSSTSLRNVTESFVDSICLSSSQDAIDADHGCGDVISRVCDSTSKASSSVRRQVEVDFVSLLGCVDPPTEDELVQVWPSVSPSCPDPTPGKDVFEKRASIQRRAELLRRLRQERFYSQVPPSNGPPTCRGAPVIPLVKTQSMDDSMLSAKSKWRKGKSASSRGTEDSFGDWLLGGGDLFDGQEEDLGQVIGKGIDPILPDHEDDVLSYDSDPGEHWLDDQPWSDPGVSSLRETSLLDMDEETPMDEPPSPRRQHVAYDGHRARIAARAKQTHVYETADPSLNDTMNCTWTLTLHSPMNVEAHDKPRCVNVWMERGTMLNMGATIVEPKIMWREVYQPDLRSNRRLSVSFQQPHSLRLLVICRILTCQASGGMDRRKFPFAQESRSFIVKTCDGGEFLFEASTEEEMIDVCQSWKMCVARLASLAVVEDMGNMAVEFFTPMVQNQMLTTY